MSEEERSSEKIVVSMKMEFNYFEETKKKKIAGAPGWLCG